MEKTHTGGLNHELAWLTLADAADSQVREATHGAVTVGSYTLLLGPPGQKATQQPRHIQTPVPMATASHSYGLSF